MSSKRTKATRLAGGAGAGAGGSLASSSRHAGAGDLSVSRGVVLPAVPSASSAAGAGSSPIALASFTGAGARPLVIGTTASLPGSHRSPVSSHRAKGGGGGAGGPMSGRKPPAGAILGRLDTAAAPPPATTQQTPPRSAAAQAAMMQHAQSTRTHGGAGHGALMFNPSPPVAAALVPSPPEHKAAVHAQFRRKPRVAASFDERKPATPTQQQLPAAFDPQPPGGRNGHAAASSRRRSAEHPPADAALLDAEEAKLAPPLPPVPPPVRPLGLLPSDIPDPTVEGEEETPIPSPSLYTAPPASLFALVATPVASSSNDAASTFQPDTQNSFVHIHSSNSDHGTASGALSTKTPTGGNAPSPMLHSPRSVRQSQRHHHQSLSSTPLPVEAGDDFLHGKSPSPTIFSFALQGKRRTLGMPMPPIGGMMSPEEETQEQAMAEENAFATDEQQPEEQQDAPRDGAESSPVTFPTGDEGEPRGIASSVTPSAATDVESARDIESAVPDFSTAPTPQIEASMETISSSAPTPIVLNLTVQINAPPSGDASTADAGVAADASRLTSLHPLLASLLPLLPESEQALLSNALHTSSVVRIGEVSLAHTTPHTDVASALASPLDSPAESVPADASPAVAAAAVNAAVVPAAAGPPRMARAKSLCVPSRGVKETDAAEVSAARCDSVKSDAVGALVPLSPSSPSSRHSASRMLLAPHTDLASHLSRKRVSFFSRSLHSLAVDDDVDALTNDLLTNSALPSATGDAPMAPFMEAEAAGDMELLQAALDQDVLLGDHEEFALNSFGGVTEESSAREQTAAAAAPEEAVASDAHTRSIHPVQRSNTAHAIGSAGVSLALSSTAAAIARSSSSTAAPGVFPASSGLSSGNGSSGRSSTAALSPASAARFRLAQPAQGEDADLFSINHATLLLERMKVEPPSTVASGGDDSDARDRSIIYAKILHHLHFLKKTITRRHFKSKETLQRKLNTITDDNQVVEWISKEFLEGAGGRGGGGVPEPSGSEANRSTGTSRRSTMGSLSTLPSPTQLQSHSRSASSHVRLNIAQYLNPSKLLGTTTEEASTANSSANASPALEKQPAQQNKVNVAAETDKAEAVRAGTNLTSGGTETGDVAQPAIVVSHVESDSAAAAASDDASPSSNGVVWSSPFAYPLSPAMLAALEARAIPTLETVDHLCVNPALAELLSTATANWNFDIFALNQLSDFHPILTLGMHAFRTVLGTYVAEAGIDLGKVFAFLVEMESAYAWENPYHNSVHAADVLQNVTYLMRSELLTDLLTPLDRLAMVIAALCHDAHHPGLTNNFLIATQHELALLYNDQSTLENHSLTQVFLLLHRRADVNFLAALPRSDQVYFRQAVVSMVLHTDMRTHVAAVNEFEQTVMRHRNSGTWFAQESRDDRRLLMDFCLHVADLGNPAKPLRLSLQWSNLILTEYYRQGDQERLAGLPLSPMADRNRPTVDVQQFSFINIIVLPLVAQLAEVLNCGILAPCVQNLAANRAYYANRMQVAKLVSGRALQTQLNALRKGEETPRAKTKRRPAAASAEKEEAPTAMMVKEPEPVAAVVADVAPTPAADVVPASVASAPASPRTPTDPEADAENATYVLSHDDSIADVEASADDAPVEAADPLPADSESAETLEDDAPAADEEEGTNDVAPEDEVADGDHEESAGEGDAELDGADADVAPDGASDTEPASDAEQAEEADALADSTADGAEGDAASPVADDDHAAQAPDELEAEADDVETDELPAADDEEAGDAEEDDLDATDDGADAREIAADEDGNPEEEPSASDPTTGPEPDVDDDDGDDDGEQ